LSAVELGIGSIRLPGDLTLPHPCTGMVVFAHGSGSSRLSPRNTAVARALNQEGFATLLFDLLTNREAQDGENAFDIKLLAQRLVSTTEWLIEQPSTRGLPAAYFGASTGAAAALVAAADLGRTISAVVSRGGRPDLAAPHLEAVVSPTLLIVGGEDRVVLEINRDALKRLRCEKVLRVIPGATHLFEEPGALEQVADLAAEWFRRFASDGSTGPHAVQA